MCYSISALLTAPLIIVLKWHKKKNNNIDNNSVKNFNLDGN